MKKSAQQIVSYDPEADVLAIYRHGKRSEEEFIEIAPNVSFELDPSGEVIGIEILNASKTLKPFVQSVRKPTLTHAV